MKRGNCLVLALGVAVLLLGHTGWVFAVSEPYDLGHPLYDAMDLEPEDGFDSLNPDASPVPVEGAAPVTMTLTSKGMKPNGGFRPPALDMMRN